MLANLGEILGGTGIGGLIGELTCDDAEDLKSSADGATEAIDPGRHLSQRFALLDYAVPQPQLRNRTFYRAD
jgi:hypothetical protein